MTRFMMTLDQAVDLVLFAFENANQGDIFVQKAPSATIHDLAVTLKDIFNSKSEIIVIGTRHGEKLYETLLSREEASKAVEYENYYKIPADNRDLNYSKYFEIGDARISSASEYTSHNTYRLKPQELCDVLLKLDFVRNEINL